MVPPLPISVKATINKCESVGNIVFNGTLKASEMIICSIIETLHSMLCLGSSIPCLFIVWLLGGTFKL